MTVQGTLVSCLPHSLASDKIFVCNLTLAVAGGTATRERPRRGRDDEAAVAVASPSGGRGAECAWRPSLAVTARVKNCQALGT